MTAFTGARAWLECGTPGHTSRLPLEGGAPAAAAQALPAGPGWGASLLRTRLYASSACSTTCPQSSMKRMITQ